MHTAQARAAAHKHWRVWTGHFHFEFKIFVEPIQIPSLHFTPQKLSVTKPSIASEILNVRSPCFTIPTYSPNVFATR